MSVTLNGIILDAQTGLPTIASRSDQSYAYLYDATQTVVDSIGANDDGTFTFTEDPGTYYLEGTADNYAGHFYGGGGFAVATPIVLVSDPVSVTMVLIPLAVDSGRFQLNGYPVPVDEGGYQGFDRPPFVTRYPLLATGYGYGGFEEAIQTGSLPRRTATITGPLVNFADVQQFRTWNDTKEVLAWVDVEQDSLSVFMFDFQCASPWSGVWQFTMILVETAGHD
jgi:hypothetical protein